MNVRSTFLIGSLLLLPIPALKAQGMCPSVTIDQRLQPMTATVVRGTVQDQGGQFVPNVNLRLIGREKSKLTETATTDDKGQFHFDSVPAGKYDITIHWTSGTAKHTQVQCDKNGVCQVAFTLKPPKQAVPCKTAYDDRIQQGRMGGIP